MTDVTVMMLHTRMHAQDENRAIQSPFERGNCRRLGGKGAPKAPSKGAPKAPPKQRGAKRPRRRLGGVPALRAGQKLHRIEHGHSEAHTSTDENTRLELLDG